MDDYFDYDQEAADSTKDATKSSNYVELPFKTTFWKWFRGLSAFQPTEGCGAKHFGGWRCDLNNMTENAKDVSERFTIEAFVSEETQQPFTCYCTRNLAIAPVAQRWRIKLTKDGKKRPSVHTLAYSALYDQDTKIYHPWMPVILCVSGWGNKKWLETAFKDWKDKTSALRTAHANNAPANFFWMSLGTFTDKRMPEKCGEGFVTPPRAFIPPPEKMTVEWLKRMFVGREMTATMGELKIQAKEWLEDWDKYREEPATATKAQPEPVKTKQPQPTYDDSPF